MSTFQQALGAANFVFTADLPLDRASTAATVRQKARLLRSHVVALQVPDAHDGRLQMSAAAAASLLLDEQVEPLVHLTGRDRNRIALENDLLGLSVLGVRSVLLTRGEELPPSYKPATRQVLELSGEDLVTTARLLGEDESIPGAQPFFIGTPATVFAPKKTWQPQSLMERVAAGAGFVQLQICFNMRSLQRYMQHLVDARLTWSCAVLAGLAVLPDAQSARALKQGLHGTVMSEKLINRMAQAVDPEREGVAICAERIARLREVPGISGVNLMTPGDPSLILAAIDAASG